ncbi:hypothetical protein NMY22_g16615 [Coprinellus aureogranulatus]|nr:hypothetical protein NMY22_g16615 [Coprinellus aureogranulatus]
MDYAISSYIPTVSTLTDRVRDVSHIDDDSMNGIFLTAQPHAPRAASIPGTTKEVSSIQNLAADRGVDVLRVDGVNVTVDDCLKNMERFRCVHLACHASQNASEPLKSRFLLEGGSLELGTIIQRNLKNVDLAFLSACQTSAGEETLSDEAVHLAAGMLAAGYRRVVATMWAIGDQHAPEVASAFYELLFDYNAKRNVPLMDGSYSAHALHGATRELRSRLDGSEKSLLAWIPFVHFGY